MNQEIAIIDKKSAFIQNWFRFEKNEVFLILSYFFYGLAFSNYEPYAPFWLSSIFKVDTFLVAGLVMVIPSFVGSIGTTVWGIAADRFGKKKFVLMGMGAYALMFLALIFTPSPIYFLIMVLVGYLFGTAHTANLYALATKSISKPKEVTLAKITMTISISWMCFSPLVGYIYDNFINAMTIQLIIAICAMAIALFFAIFLKEKIDVKEEVEQEIMTTVSTLDNEQVSVKKPLTVIPFLFAGIMLLVFMFQMTAGFWAYTGIYFLDTLHVEGKYFSIFLIIKTAVAVPLSFLLSRIKSTKTYSWVTIIFIGWICLDYLLMMLFPTNWIMIIIIYSVPMYPLYNIAFYSLVTSATNKEKRATAYGVFNTIGTVGYIIGILLLGLAADLHYSGIYIMFTVSLIFGAVTLANAILLFIFKTRKEIAIPIEEVEKPIEEKEKDEVLLYQS
ncbi:MAG: MFS transporter [Candidatus Heimdallarchaeota archaeon]